MIFEVLSPSSGRTDQIEKLREYQAIPSVRRYVLLQHRGMGLTVLTRAPTAFDWTATSLVAEDTLRLPEISVDLPVAELYEGIQFPNDGRWPPDSNEIADD